MRSDLPLFKPSALSRLPWGCALHARLSAPELKVSPIVLRTTTLILFNAISQLLIVKFSWTNIGVVLSKR